MNISFIKVGLFITTCILLSNCNPNHTNSKLTHSLKQLISDENKYDSTVFEQAFKKLNTGGTLSKFEIEEFSKSIETRADFYNLLAEFNKESLFPQ
jgi:hypothetical protein